MFARIFFQEFKSVLKVSNEICLPIKIEMFSLAPAWGSKARNQVELCIHPHFPPTLPQSSKECFVLMGGVFAF